MYNEKITNALFEAVFRQAIIENYQQELTEIPSEIELAKIYTFSERHNERMKNSLPEKSEKSALTICQEEAKTLLSQCLL
ncbi:MAG: hypothetical protein GX815_09265 [Clostridiales bacterium]|nr:hypothetical protein [Clostridiales bacterium]